MDRVYTHLLVEDLRSAINSIAPKRLRLSPLGCADTPCTGSVQRASSLMCEFSMPSGSRQPTWMSFSCFRPNLKFPT